MTTDRATSFVALWNRLTDGWVTDYGDVYLDNLPDPDSLDRYAYLYTDGEDDQPALVTMHPTSSRAQDDARSDVYDPRMAWPVAILDLDARTITRVEVSVTFATEEA